MKPLLLIGAWLLLCCGASQDDTAPAACDQCQLEPEVGPCNAAFLRYYFDQADQECRQFVWGGCGGVVPFETLEACEDCNCQ